jgi:hypothetical protein
MGSLAVTTQVALTSGLALGYVLAITGSMGMIVFAKRFPFSSSIKDLVLARERFGPLNGYQVWVWSWSLIIVGGILQLTFSVAMGICQR